MSFREVTSFERSSTPYSAIGLVNVTWPDGTRASGSAAVVGRNDILTAAHVVYNPDRGGWATGLEFFFGSDYNDALGYFESYGYRLTSGFRWEVKAGIQGTFADANNSTFWSSESQYDIALIGVDVEIGKQTGWLGLDPGRDFTQTVNAAGYPAGAAGLMTERVTVTSSNRWGIYEGTSQMREGSSGGPLFTDDNYVLGVMSAGLGTYSAWADLGFSWHWIKPFMDENDAMLGTGIVPRVPTYSLVAQSGSVNEGESARFTLTTTNVAAFTTLTYRITGVQAEDIQDGRLSGTVVVGQDGKATIAIPIKKDLITEGDETLRIAVETATASVLVKDTSKTINYTNGDRYAGDVINGQRHGEGTYTFASGSKYVGEWRDDKYHGQGTYTWPNGDKYVGEFKAGEFHGQGTYTFADGRIWSGEWRDDKLMPPVYTLRPQSSTIDEGKTSHFDLVVSNFKEGTVFLYSITGVQAEDIVGGQLTGSVTLDAQGRASILIPIAADNLTEGPETLTLTLRTLFKEKEPDGDFGSITANVTINDTSRAVGESTVGGGGSVSGPTLVSDVLGSLGIVVTPIALSVMSARAQRLIDNGVDPAQSPLSFSVFLLANPEVRSSVSGQGVAQITSLSNIVRASAEGALQTPSHQRVLLTDLMSFDASQGAFNLVLDFTAMTSPQSVARVSGYGADDRITIVGKPVGSSGQFESNAPTRIDFGYGDSSDFNPYWVVSFTGLDTTTVTAVNAAPTFAAKANAFNVFGA